MKPKLKTVCRKKKLKRLKPQTLTNKEWISGCVEFQMLAHRRRAVKWLLPTFTAALLCTFGIIMLDGFNAMGFSLPESVLKQLGFAANTGVVGLAGIVFRFLFKA